MEVFYLKVNQPFKTTSYYLNQWFNIVNQFPNFKIYIICDKLALAESIINTFGTGGGYNFEIIPSARDSEELKYIVDNAIVENWKPAGYAHLTTFLHARENGYKDFWNIDADDIGLYAKPRKIAKILKNVKDYSVNHAINLISLDCWITNSDGDNWSYGVSYTDNSVDWIELLKKHCKDYAHVEHYKKFHIPNNADELTNYLRKVEDVKVETFYVENLHAIHHHDNIYNNVYCGVRHWADGRCYWHVMSEIFGMGKAGSLPIPEVAIKFDIGLTVEESLRCLKNACMEIGTIKHFEKINRVADVEITAILPLDGSVDDVKACLANLLSQNLKNFRLIVTDAGLSDVALKMCREAQPYFDGRMEIITGLTKEKLFDAGLKAAKGRYVIFINGGDAFISESFMFLYGVIENTRADVVHTSNYFVPNDEGKLILQTEENLWGDDLKAINMLPRVKEKIIAWANDALSPSIYNKLIRREFLEEEKISLPFTNYVSQWIFSLQCLMLAENYVRVAQPLYGRIVSRKNISEDLPAQIKSLYEGAQALQKLIDEVLFFDEYANAKNIIKIMYKMLSKKILDEV